MNVGCWKRQCCFQQPHGCILTSVSQFLPISRLYMADFGVRPDVFRLYMAVSLREYAQNVPPKWCFAVSKCHM